MEASEDKAKPAEKGEKQKALWKTAQEKILAAVCVVPFSELLQVWAISEKLDLGYEAQVHRRVRAALVYLSAQQGSGDTHAG